MARQGKWMTYDPDGESNPGMAMAQGGMSGAGLGGMVGGPIGMGIGAGVGALGGLISDAFTEDEDPQEVYVPYGQQEPVDYNRTYGLDFNRMLMMLGMGISGNKDAWGLGDKPPVPTSQYSNRFSNPAFLQPQAQQQFQQPMGSFGPSMGPVGYAPQQDPLYALFGLA